MKDTNYLQMIEEAKVEAKIYGDAFVYIIPYKEAVDKLLYNKNNIGADLNTESLQDK